jgi:hypothetical protein
MNPPPPERNSEVATGVYFDKAFGIQNLFAEPPEGRGSQQIIRNKTLDRSLPPRSRASLVEYVDNHLQLFEKTTLFLLS